MCGSENQRRESKARTRGGLERKLISDDGQISSFESQQP